MVIIILKHIKTLIKIAKGEVQLWYLISMGTKVSDIDLLNIRELCDQVLALSKYKGQLYDIDLLRHT
jgi:RNA processing factor Prp31